MRQLTEVFTDAFILEAPITDMFTIEALVDGLAALAETAAECADTLAEALTYVVIPAALLTDTSTIEALVDGLAALAETATECAHALTEVFTHVFISEAPITDVLTIEALVDGLTVLVVTAAECAHALTVLIADVLSIEALIPVVPTFEAPVDGLAALAETAAEYADALTEVLIPGVLTIEAIIPNAQGLANALWAMAKTGTRTPAVFEAICAEASRKAGLQCARDCQRSGPRLRQAHRCLMSSRLSAQKCPGRCKRSRLLQASGASKPRQCTEH